MFPQVGVGLLVTQRGASETSYSVRLEFYRRLDTVVLCGRLPRGDLTSTSQLVMDLVYPLAVFQVKLLYCIPHSLARFIE